MKFIITNKRGLKKSYLTIGDSRTGKCYYRKYHGLIPVVYKRYEWRYTC